MKTKTIITIAARVAGVIAAVKAVDIFNAINKNAKSLADQEAWKNLGKDDADLYSDTASKIVDLENTEGIIADVVNKATDKVKEEMSFNRKMSEIDRTYRDHVKTIKNTIDYDANKEKFNNFVTDTVDNFKKSINYDEKVKEINEKISEVKSDYEKTKTLYSIVGDTESDKKIKKILKDGKNDKIDRLKKEIKDLDDKVNDIRKTASETASNELMNLEKQLTEALADPKRAKDEAISKLKDTLSDKVSEIKNRYLAENGIDELDIMLKKDTLQADIDRIEANIKIDANDIYNGKSFARKLGEYLKFRNVKKITVNMVALLPILAMSFIVRAYRHKVKEVLAWM